MDTKGYFSLSHEKVTYEKPLVLWHDGFLGLYSHKYVFIYIHTHGIHADSTYMHTYTHAHTHTRTYTHTQTHTHTYVYIYIHTYVHTYTHT